MEKIINSLTPMGIALIGCSLAGISLFTPWGDKIAPSIASAALAGSLGLAQSSRDKNNDSND
jgi:hypothetical protein